MDCRSVPPANTIPCNRHSSARLPLNFVGTRRAPILSKRVHYLRQDLANASLPDLGSSRLATGGSSRNDPAGDGYGGGDDTDTGDDDIGSDSAAAGEEDGLSFGDVKHAFNEMTGLLEGPCPIPDLDQFVGLGTAVAGDLGDGVYGQVVNNMESGWVSGERGVSIPRPTSCGCHSLSML